MFINHSSKEVTAKIVYYGPGLSGKTTCLQYIFSVTNPKTRGELISIETEIERTLFFDLLPINVGLIKGYQTKFQLYTVPGQIFYDSTRKLVLKGADGIVFVADSQKIMDEPNRDSLNNLKLNLVAHRLDILDIPMIFQYNKRDLGNILSIRDLNKALNPRDCAHFGSVATKGEGVIEALREISSQILKKIKFLLDHGEDSATAMPPVQFDTNKKHKIIDKEHLPLKKIHAESLDNIDQKLLPENMPPKSLEYLLEKFPAEELKVETVEEIEKLHDIVIDEEDAAAEPLPELEEINLDEGDRESDRTGKAAPAVEAVEMPTPPGFGEIDDPDQDPLGKTVLEMDVDATVYKKMEEAAEQKVKKEKKKETEIEEDNEPFKDLQDIHLHLDVEADVTRIEFEDDAEEVQELKDIGELVENGHTKQEPEPREPELKDSNDNKDAEPFKLDEIKEEELNIELSEAILKEPQAPAIKTPKEAKPAKLSKEIEELEALKKSLQREEIKNKTIKNPVITKGLDLFDQLKDKTRITIIKEVPFSDLETNNQFLIDIKDKNSNILESIKVDMTPEIKKVTLIIDVKK
jgi:signal recognition particle receptor subunit beta